MDRLNGWNTHSRLLQGITFLSLPGGIGLFNINMWCAFAAGKMELSPALSRWSVVTNCLLTKSGAWSPAPALSPVSHLCCVALSGQCLAVGQPWVRYACCASGSSSLFPGISPFEKSQDHHHHVSVVQKRLGGVQMLDCFGRDQAGISAKCEMDSLSQLQKGTKLVHFHRS